MTMAGNEGLFQKAMNQGHSAAWDGQWDQASFFYRQALEQYPDNPVALTNLGLALLELQQFEEALNCYRRAAVITPEDPLPVEKVAQISERLGNLMDATRNGLLAADLYIKTREVDKAIENWVRVTRFNPDHLTAHSRLAMIYERLGRKADAVSEYLAVAALVQSAGDSVKASQAVNYAFMLMPDSRDTRQALATIKANQVLPKPARPRSGTGSILMAKVRQLETPLNEPQNTSGMDPITEARQKALVNLAGILFDQSDEETENPSSGRGLHSITRGSNSSSNEITDRDKITSHLSQAIDSQTQGRNDIAILELQKAIEAELIQPAAYYDLGFLLYQEGQQDLARANLRLALKNPDFSLASRLLLGGSLYKEGRVCDGALEYLEALKIADLATIRPEQANEIAQLYESLIDSQSQLVDKKVCENLCVNIASFLERPDWKEQIKQARQQLPEQKEENAPLPLAEVMFQFHSSRVVESLVTIQRMAENNHLRTATEEAFYALIYAPNYLPLHIQIAELLLKDNHIQEAIQKYLIVAQTYNVRGETTQATQLLRRIIQLNPVDLSIRSRLIESLMAQGKIDEAIHEDLELADTYYRLTELDVARKTYMGALRLAQQSNSNRKWSSRILNRVADIDMQRMDWRQALRVFEQIRILQPEDEKVRQNIIDINFRIGQEGAGLNELDSFIDFLESKAQRAKAIHFLKDLTADRPEKIELHKKLADLYQKGGQTTQAISEMDKILELLNRTGNKTAAISVCQAIINLNPPNLKEYQELLQQLRFTKK
jgi:tetratricopeptide (TPR) repeat protein